MFSRILMQVGLLTVAATAAPFLFKAIVNS